jgi:hypothetical protein
VHPAARTFMVLPPHANVAARHFEPARNVCAQDEVRAHVGMFSGTTNDGYYELGLAVAQYIHNAVERARGVGEKVGGSVNMDAGAEGGVSESKGVEADRAQENEDDLLL